MVVDRLRAAVWKEDMVGALRLATAAANNRAMLVSILRRQWVVCRIRREVMERIRMVIWPSKDRLVGMVNIVCGVQLMVKWLDFEGRLGLGGVVDLGGGMGVGLGVHEPRPICLNGGDSEGQTQDDLAGHHPSNIGDSKRLLESGARSDSFTQIPRAPPTTQARARAAPLPIMLRKSRSFLPPDRNFDYLLPLSTCFYGILI